jgi:PAS domain S-box-containing protein
MDDPSEPLKLPSPIAWLDQKPDDEISEELRQARAAFQSVVDSLPLNLLIKDAQGRRVFANKCYLEFHGSSLDNMVGKTDFDLFPEELALKFTQDDAAILESGKAMHDVEEHQLPDGQQRWIERTKSPLRDADGKIVGVQILFWDVTDRQQAQQALDHERDLLQTLMDNIPDDIFFKDKASRFVRASKAIATRSGLLDPKELIGKSDSDIFSEEYAQATLRDEQRVMETGEPLVGKEERRVWADGHVTWSSTTKLPLHDKESNIIGTFGISRNITPLKIAQDNLREARDAADSANRAKSDFLANMSHEIRTPMNGIIGMTELMLDTKLTPTQYEYLRMVQDSGESLLALVNDILDFSKIEAGQMELDPASFDLRDSLGDTLKSLAMRSHGKGLELAFAVDPDVPWVLEGDLGRLRQVIVNLIGNAIKFTDEGEILLDISCQARTNSNCTLLFSIRDTGIGIPPDTQSRIFEDFQQADRSTTRRYGGTGLGLAISSRLVELMGGRIGVDSEPDCGSTFYFTANFPISGSIDHQYSVQFSQTPVLIVDDNETSRRILFDMLTNWGLNPTVATNAREAFDILRDAMSGKAPFQLALVDANMPDVDGFQFASWVRDEETVAKTPLVMLTSAGQPGDALRQSSFNITATLLKPVKQSELFDAVVATLGVRSHEQEPEEQLPITAPLQSVRVLLAEDNRVNQKLAKVVLEKLGCQVTVVANGARAVAAWSEQEFDVVLMDVEMPEMDGFDATTEIRRREQDSKQHIPIIAMTAHAMVGDRERCLEAGMDDYLSKPVRMDQIRTMLTKTLFSDAPPAGSTEETDT